MDLAGFRARYPAFVSFTDAQVNAALADSLLDFDPARWGDRMDINQGRWVAHMLAIGAADGYAPNGSAKPAVDANDVTSRDTEHVKISRSERMVELQGVNHWTRTVWGQQYLYEARIMGMGGVAA